MKMWLKSLTAKCRFWRVFYSSFFNFMTLFILFFSSLWNIIIYKIGGLKPINNEEYYEYEQIKELFIIRRRPLWFR